VLAFFLWIGFTLLLAGYCTSVFLMVEFVMSVLFFVCLGVLLHATVVLPWLGIVLVVSFYANDTLATINAEHCYILKLIDDNSPRISAVEENEEVNYLVYHH